MSTTELAADPTERSRSGGAIVVVLAGVAVVVGGIGYVGRFIRYRSGSSLDPPWISRNFDLTTEGNLATWFASGILLVLVAAFLLRAATARTRGRALTWVGFSVAALAMSLDEATSLHETYLGRLGDDMVPNTGGLLWHSWVVPGAILAAVGGILAIWGARQIDPRDRLLLVLAGATFAAGALGLEAVAGATEERRGGPDEIHLTVSTAEELLEVAGVLIALWAALGRTTLRRVAGELRWSTPG